MNTGLAILCLFLLLIIALLGGVWLDLHELKRMNKANIDSQPEPVEGGMNLMLLKPKPKRKAVRFTDKSRDWILAKETASRR